MTDQSLGRIDFHVHSRASNITDYYAANSFAIPESYSDPIATWHELKRQGMTLVTLTDHNSIDGVREMLGAGLPGVFICAEMTTTFPEDGCNIHVTVANMTESQFTEVDRLRGNVYEMIDYLDQQIAHEAQHPAGNRLAYFMTHPLMSTQNRPYGREGSLTIEHIEKALLLCNCLEVRNGTRTKSLNELTHRLITSLDRDTIDRLANVHGIRPKGDTPWLKAVVAGSDDHSGINPGMTWTELPVPGTGLLTANDVVDAIRSRQTRPMGAHGGPVTLAHAMVKLLYDGNSTRNRSAGQKAVSMAGPIHSLLRFVFDSGSMRLHERLLFKARCMLQTLLDGGGKGRGRADLPFEKILAGQARLLLGNAAFRKSLAAVERTDDRIFQVVSTLLNRIFATYVGRITRADSVHLVRTVRELVTLISSNLFVSLPYLLSYLHQSSDRSIVQDARKRFDIAEKTRLVLVTDTLFDINGVARTIQKMIEEAGRRGIDFTVVTCLGEAERERACAAPHIQRYLESGQLKILPAVVNLDFPEYQGLQIRFPPFLELLKFLQESGFTKMQISTPGTVGIAGLLAAKLLQIETSSTYHTSFPEYVENYTRDVSLEALAWKYMILFYHSVDEVVVPSKFIARLLHERGLRNRKLLILDRWVDLDRFHPRKRVCGFWRRFGLVNEAALVKFLYVGRVGLEKNLATMADAYLQLRQQHPEAHLIVVGDGPYRQELEQRLAGAPSTFTGFREGEELAQAFASADVKLFPSTTDTWGNAPLEAQSSGLPVVVSDKGGPHELIVDGVTGFKVRGRDTAALLQAMVQLMDRDVRERMGHAAREFVETNRVDEPFSAILDTGAYRQRIKRLRKLAPSERPTDHTTDLSTDHIGDHAAEQDAFEASVLDHRARPASAAGA